MDLAASVQVVLEEVVLRMTRALAAETGAKNLCLAGGVALNCVANGRLLRDGHFEKIWIQPAAGDAGGALGAALAAYHSFKGQPRKTNRCCDNMKGAYFGPEFSQTDIERRLTAAGARYVVLGDDELLDACADALESEKAVGWFQGRMEFGPRALGGPLNSRRRSLSQNAVHAQPQSEVSRILPSVCSFRLARECVRMVRTRSGQPLHAARGKCAGAAA